MKALITGASSGIGRDMARVLHRMGYGLILAARRYDRLEELKNELGGEVEIYSVDLGNKNECVEFVDKIKDKDIDFVINNAGFGLLGEFVETDLEKETEMIDVNITALHIITKEFLKIFDKKDKGHILNVASSAAFLPGPLLATYYATKAYVMRLTVALGEEERKRGKKNVKLSCLCPGPVNTEFDKVANVKFSLASLSSEFVAEYAIKKALKGKKIIIPGFGMRFLVGLQKFLPETLLVKIAYRIQKKKTKSDN